MPKTIWSEGRVLGLNQYELYARYVTADGGNPSNEKSWLASTLSYGASLLLWVAPDTVENAHYRDFEFPTNCRLGAANTIMASFFAGAGNVLDSTVDTWATKVVDYGPLIENDSTASPSGSSIPVKDNGAVDATTVSPHLSQ